MMGAGFKYFTQNKLYIWKKDKEKDKTKRPPASKDEIKIRMMSEEGLNGSKLRDLAWSLDVLDLSRHKNEL